MLWTYARDCRLAVLFSVGLWGLLMGLLFGLLIGLEDDCLCPHLDLEADFLLVRFVARERILCVAARRAMRLGWSTGCPR